MDALMLMHMRQVYRSLHMCREQSMLKNLTNQVKLLTKLWKGFQLSPVGFLTTKSGFLTQ